MFAIPTPSPATPIPIPRSLASPRPARRPLRLLRRWAGGLGAGLAVLAVPARAVPAAATPASVAAPVAPSRAAAHPSRPASAPRPAADANAPRRWEVRIQDITLARTLERWAADAGYRLKWDAQRNFLIGAPDAYEGTFLAALEAVLGSAGIRQSDYPLEACLYENSPPLVRVTRQGEQVRECDAP